MTMMKVYYKGEVKIEREVIEDTQFDLYNATTHRVVSRYKVAYGWIVETMLRTAQHSPTITSVFVSDPDHSQFKVKEK